MKILYESQENLILIGGGAADMGDMDLARSFATGVVAADGGADFALKCGVLPDAVIGDLDSISAQARAEIPETRVHKIAEQDSTDFDKCLRSIRAPVLLGVGFLGARVDHLLACCTVLARRSDVRCILIGRDDVVFACPRSLRIALPVGTRFSVFPMTELRGTSVGLRWPLDGIELAPDGPIGTSNETSLEDVSLSFDRAGVIAILPRAFLGNVITALRPAPPAAHER